MRKVCIVGASGQLGKYMVQALENDELVHAAPAIVGGKTASALTLPNSPRQ
jgi:dihydrodipicolinate reductase